jgi:putative transposase
MRFSALAASVPAVVIPAIAAHSGTRPAIAAANLPLYVFAVIEHVGRRVRVPRGDTAHRIAGRVVQATKNLVMDLEGHRLPGAVPDPRPGTQISELFNAVLADAGIDVVLSGVRMPRMNSIIERVGTDLPPRAAGLDLDLEPTAPAARRPRVRTVLQRTPGRTRASRNARPLCPLPPGCPAPGLMETSKPGRRSSYAGTEEVPG